VIVVAPAETGAASVLVALLEKSRVVIGPHWV